MISTSVFNVSSSHFIFLQYWIATSLSQSFYAPTFPPHRCFVFLHPIECTILMHEMCSHLHMLIHSGSSFLVICPFSSITPLRKLLCHHKISCNTISVPYSKNLNLLYIPTITPYMSKMTMLALALNKVKKKK